MTERGVSSSQGDQEATLLLKSEGTGEEKVFQAEGTARGKS